MGDFYDYVEKERMAQKHTKVQQQEEAPVYGVEEKAYLGAEDDMEIQYRRYAFTSFQERSRYYFESKEMIDEKEAKYKSLSKFGNKSLNHYAATHTSRSGYKRKKKAKETSKLYNEAGKLSARLNQIREDCKKNKTNISHQEEFDLRKAILEKRIEAMKKAAEVKSTGQQDELYRKAKAELKGNLLLLDLAKKTITLDLKDYVAELEEKIRQAERDMHRYGENRAIAVLDGGKVDWVSDSPSEKMEQAHKLDYWRRKEIERDEGLKKGRHDSDYIKSFEEEVEKKKKSEPKAVEHFTKESYEILKTFRLQNQHVHNPQYMYSFDPNIQFRYQNEISRLAGNMLRPVKYDEKWEPKSVDDLNNHWFNVTVCNLIRKIREGDEEAESKLTNAMKEEMKRVYKEAPNLIPPEEIEKELINPLAEQKSLENVSPECMEKLVKNPEYASEMSLRTLTFEGLPKFLPKVGEFLEEDKAISAYFDAYRSYHLIFQFYMKGKYSVNPKQGASADIEYVAPDPDLFKGFLEAYKADYKKYQEIAQKNTDNKLEK